MLEDGEGGTLANECWKVGEGEHWQMNECWKVGEGEHW